MLRRGTRPEVGPRRTPRGPTSLLLARLYRMGRPLGVFNFDEFLLGEALLLELSCGSKSADFAFEFSRPWFVEFDFTWHRTDRDAIVEDPWRGFSKRVDFGYAFAVVEEF